MKEGGMKKPNLKSSEKTLFSPAFTAHKVPGKLFTGSYPGAGLGAGKAGSAPARCGLPQGIINTFPGALCGPQITALGANAGRHWYNGNKDGAWAHGGRHCGSAPRKTCARVIAGGARAVTITIASGRHRRVWAVMLPPVCTKAAVIKAKMGSEGLLYSRVRGTGGQRAGSRDCPQKAAPGTRHLPTPKAGSPFTCWVSSAC